VGSIVRFLPITYDDVDILYDLWYYAKLEEVSFIMETNGFHDKYFDNLRLGKKTRTERIFEYLIITDKYFDQINEKDLCNMYFNNKEYIVKQIIYTDIEIKKIKCNYFQ
jgi:hypothetical protein